MVCFLVHFNEVGTSEVGIGEDPSVLVQLKDIKKF